MYITEIGNIALEKSPVLSFFGCLEHGFTTRRGGVSSQEYESLSMSPWRGDSIENIRENERILCEALSLDLTRLTATKQEHTDVVEIIDENRIGYGIKIPWEKGVDACITKVKNIPLLCYSADCVPILFYAKDIEAVAAVHAGWRGTVSRIAEKTLDKMYEMGARGENIFAAIGPCIHKCCYEVSGDVAEQFDKKYYSEVSGGKYMLDLAEANRDIIEKSGVKDVNISVSDACTKCNNELFFSHRGQGGKSGTLAGIICMRD